MRTHRGPREEPSIEQLVDGTEAKIYRGDRPISLLSASKDSYSYLIYDIRTGRYFSTYSYAVHFIDAKTQPPTDLDADA